ncbi:hypothetical protein EVAR_53906_1 [Eumeta japonica]|uniref:Uncharacterized protein n=1 Tax=Eumeta variegata TaxID=151549 RepID=A0A4C1YGA3_EUMVA|nr:hypothetical protein EVAR_53906_1 [Eumeta japonica]
MATTRRHIVKGEKLKSTNCDKYRINYDNEQVFENHIQAYSGARRRRRRRPPTASRLKGPRKQKSFAYKLLKRGLAKSFAYKLLKRGLANLMSPTSTSGVAPPLQAYLIIFRFERQFRIYNDLKLVSNHFHLNVKNL